MPEQSVITPTRRLNKAQRAVFDRVIAEFIHLTSSDAEQLTQLAEATIRYQTAERETRKNPTISVPVVNRATGNITGEKIVRNPAFTTVKEAQSQMNALARRLIIDAASAEKRQRLLTKKARALAAAEAAKRQSQSAEAKLTEDEIQTEMDEVRKVYITATEEVVRAEAIWRLTVFYPFMNDPEVVEELFTPLDSFKSMMPTR
jgi:uncharacterized membrane-anchored protein YjiN (DUF445 family)